MKKNARTWIFIALSALTVVTVLFVYMFYQNKQEEKAQTLLSQHDEALPEEKYDLYNQLYKTYSNTKAGNTALYKLGMLYYADQTYQKALDCFKKAKIKDTNVNAEKNFLSSQCYVALKKHKKALPYAQKAVNAQSPICPVKHLLGLCNVYVSLGRKKEAFDCLQKICDEYPDYHDLGHVQKLKVSIQKVIEDKSNT